MRAPRSRPRPLGGGGKRLRCKVRGSAAGGDPLDPIEDDRYSHDSPAEERTAGTDAELLRMAQENSLLLKQMTPPPAPPTHPPPPAPPTHPPPPAPPTHPPPPAPPPYAPPPQAVYRDPAASYGARFVTPTQVTQIHQQAAHQRAVQELQHLLHLNAMAPIGSQRKLDLEMRIRAHPLAPMLVAQPSRPVAPTAVANAVVPPVYPQVAASGTQAGAQQSDPAETGWLKSYWKYVPAAALAAGEAYAYYTGDDRFRPSAYAKNLFTPKTAAQKIAEGASDLVSEYVPEDVQKVGTGLSGVYGLLRTGLGNYIGGLGYLGTQGYNYFYPPGATPGATPT